MTRQVPAGRVDPGFPDEPPPAPDGDEQCCLQEWAMLSELSLREVGESAAKWKEGLLGLVTTCTSGFLLVRGVGLGEVAGAWFWAVLALWTLAAASGLLGIWCGLSATAGTPARLDYHTFVAIYRSVDELRRQHNRKVAKKLAIARAAVVVSVACTLLGALVSQAAPAEAGPKLLVKTAAGTYCGTVKSADHGEIHLVLAGERDPRIIPFAAITNLSPRASC